MKNWIFTNGSKMKHYLDNVFVILLLCFSSYLFAEDRTSEETKPSIEFLEFLGEWETNEGEWIDPIELEDDELGKLIETSTTDENEN